MKVGDTVWYCHADFYCGTVTIMKVKLTAVDYRDLRGVLSYYTDKGFRTGVASIFHTREEAEAYAKAIIKSTYDMLMNQLKNPEPKQRWRNIKNNRVYTVLHVTKDVTENKGTPVVVYALGDDVFVRTVDEFKEKFEEVKG